MITKPTKLTVELVPQYRSVSETSSLFSREVWDKMTKQIFKEADFCCEICGSTVPPLECHEEWHFDDITKTQKLVRLMALCTECHQTKHFDFYMALPPKKSLLFHLTMVNDWSREQAEEHIDQALNLWTERSHFQWHLDRSYLQTKFGVNVKVIENYLQNIL